MAGWKKILPSAVSGLVKFIQATCKPILSRIVI